MSTHSECVSVIVRAHLDAPYLNECLISIEGQDYLGAIQIIIILDNITDEVKSLIDNFHSKHEISVIENNGGNIARGLNLAINKSEAKLIAILDSDDRMLYSRIRKQVDFIRNSNYTVVGSNLKLINELGEEIGIAFMPQDDQVRFLLSEISTIAHPASMYIRENILRIGGYREFFEYAEDYDLWIRASEKFEVGNMNEILTEYIVHSDQLTKSKLSRHVWAVLATKISSDLRMSGQLDLPEVFSSIEDWKANGDRKFTRLLKFRISFSKARITKSEASFSVIRLADILVIFILDPMFIFSKLNLRRRWR